MSNLFMELELWWWSCQATCRNIDRRVRACRQLADIEDARAIAVLVKCLEDRISRVREAVCLALAQVGDATVVPALLARLTDESDIVRDAVCVALGALGDAQAVEPLIGWLNDERWFLRAHICRALGRIGHPSATRALLARVTDTDPVVREAACEALGAIGDANAIVPLLERMIDEKPVQTAAAKALYAMRQGVLAEVVRELIDLNHSGRMLQAIKETDRLYLLPVLQRWLTHPREELRLAAGIGLGRLGERDVLPKLLTYLDDPRWPVQRLVINTLKGMPDPMAVRPLIGCLHAGDAPVREEACRALGAIGDACALVPLVEAMGDRHTREAATAALRAMRREAVVALFAEYAQSDIGHETIPLLEEDLAALLPALQEWLAHPSAELRAMGCRALGRLRFHQALEALLARLEDEDALVRRAACAALCWLPDTRATAPLIRRLDDPDALVRELACQLLGKLSSRQAIPGLIARLGDLSDPVRLTAGTALVALGEPHLALLAQALHGETDALEGVTDLIGAGDVRLLGPLTTLVCNLPSDHVLVARADAVMQAVQRALRPTTDSLLCRRCLVRLETQRLPRNSAVRVLTCRTCGTADDLLTGIHEVMAVLDRGMAAEIDRQGARLHVHALRRGRPFDLDGVIVRDADDFAVERFCMQIGNDTDPQRAARYRTLPVTVAAECRLSANTLRVLDHIFGTVYGGQDAAVKDG
jgi:HEAT repeat protein